MPNSKKTKNTPDHPQIGKEAVSRYRAQCHQRFDRLIVQQCAVRRFQLEHSETHQALCRVKQAATDLLRDVAFERRTLLLTGSLSTNLSIALELFETQQGRRAIRNCDVPCAINIMKSHPEISIASPLQAHDFVEDLLSIFAAHLHTIENAQAEYNFFDYFTLLGMTTTFKGDAAFKTFEDAQYGKLPLLPPFQTQNESADPALSSPYLGYNRWFYLGAVIDDIDLECALALASRPRAFQSLSVDILDTAANPHLQISGGSTRQLHLAISLDRAPIDIDNAIGYLSGALKQLLVEEHGCWANVPGHEEYSRTHFARKREPAPLLREKSQFQGMLLGIWCWDLVHFRGIRKTAAYDEIREALGHESFEELKTNLRHIERFISHSPSRESAIDITVTGSAGRRLGRRAK